MLIWLVLGAVVLSLRSWKQRERKSADIFAIFVFVYSVFFVLSGWSVTDVVRYLYLLMIAVPVLLLAPLRLVRTRILSGLAALVLMGALIGANIGSVGEYYGSTVRAEQIYEKTISAMEATGVEYWMAEYWRAYALTAVSGERLIVRSFTMNRYLPYSLAYDNAGQGDNYVFMGEKNSPNDILSRNLEALLMRLDIPFRKTSMGDVSLFYRIESDVFPPVLKEKPPENIPRFEIADLSFEKGRLRLAFRLSKPIAADRFRLVLEIPGYNRKKIWLSKGQEWMSTMLSYPPGGPFTLLTSVEYGGLRIDTTVREMEISPPATPDPQPPGTVFFLRGISPEFDYGDRRLRYCEPDAAFRVAPPFSGAETRLRIYLDSPFEFSRSPGCADYRQTVVFRSKGRRFLQRNLLDGMNVIDLVLPPSSGSDPEEIEMNFSWQAWFEFAPFRRLSAVLEKVEFIEPGTGDH
jgi:hypothetical protein